MIEKINIKHTAAALIIFFSVSLFFQIDKAEIQPWDEGLYAMRALSIVKYGDIWDQSAHSIGGLYSATYPPLTVWAIAGLMSFAEPHSAVRIFSAVCGSLALLFIYLISRRFLSGDMSLVSIIGLAVTVTWNKYSRQGMTDVPLMTFALISLWALIKFMESDSARKNFPFLIIFALSFAAGLMTKVIISFLPLLFVLYFFLKAEKNKKTLLIISSVSGLVLSAPWHLYMAMKHGFEFYRVFFTPHIYSSVENNTPVLGIFYYVNQLIIANPFLIIAIIVLFAFLIKRQKIMSLFIDNENYYLKLLLLWFGTGFIFLSISATKLPHYTLYIILPGILISGLLIDKSDRGEIGVVWKYWLLSAIVIAFMWSISYELRQELKQLVTLTGFSPRAVFYLLLLGFLVYFGFKSDSALKDRILNRSFISISYIILFILIIKIIVISVFYFEGSIRGGIDTAYYLEKSEKKSFVYLYHEHNASDSLNPQLAWYTQGWTCGWRKGMTMHNFPMPLNRLDFNVINASDSITKDFLVYYLPEDKVLEEAVTNEIKQTRHLINRKRNYAIFSPVMFKRNKGITI